MVTLPFGAASDHGSLGAAAAAYREGLPRACCTVMLLLVDELSEQHPCQTHTHARQQQQQQQRDVSECSLLAALFFCSLRYALCSMLFHALNALCLLSPFGTCTRRDMLLDWRVVSQCSPSVSPRCRCPHAWINWGAEDMFGETNA